MHLQQPLALFFAGEIKPAGGCVVLAAVCPWQGPAGRLLVLHKGGKSPLVPAFLCLLISIAGDPRLAPPVYCLTLSPTFGAVN